MSQSIINVIYGIPLTSRASDLINEWRKADSERFYDSNEVVCGFTTLYHSSSMDYVGYCGVKLTSFSNDIAKKNLRLEPTEQEILRAEDQILQIDPELLALCPEPGVYFVISTD